MIVARLGCAGLRFERSCKMGGRSAAHRRSSHGPLCPPSVPVCWAAATLECTSRGPWSSTRTRSVPAVSLFLCCIVALDGALGCIRAVQETIKKGGDKDLPALCDLLKEDEFKSMKVSIEGHVNFGQSPADAKKLSDVRMDACVWTLDLVVALSS